MTRRLALLGAAVLACAGLGVAAPAVADPVNRCSTSTGVLVVVDSRPLGGQVNRGCDADPSTGFDALHTAGFTTEGTQHDGPGFICRINERPTKAQDKCVRTPPASAYWSYWHANAGQTSWSYSRLGATSYKPEDGSIDAWVFGATDVGGTRGGPCFSPADARAGRATACSSAPKPTKSTAPTRTSEAGGGTGRTAAPKTGTGTSTPVRGASTSSTTTSGATTSGAEPTTTGGATTSRPDPTATTSRAATSSPAVSGGVPAIVDATPVSADSTGGGGSALPIVLVAGLVLILGGGAGWTVLRRRRADAEL